MFIVFNSCARDWITVSIELQFERIIIKLLGSLFFIFHAKWSVTMRMTIFFFMGLISGRTEPNLWLIYDVDFSSPYKATVLHTLPKSRRALLIPRLVTNRWRISGIAVPTFLYRRWWPSSKKRSRAFSFYSHESSSRVDWNSQISYQNAYTSEPLLFAETFEIEMQTESNFEHRGNRHFTSLNSSTRAFYCVQIRTHKTHRELFWGECFNSNICENRKSCFYIDITVYYYMTG